MNPVFILASGSSIRRTLLENAGVAFETAPSHVDEDAIKRASAGLGPDALAMRLADAKALAVSRGRPEALVLGADQILSLDGVMHDKAGSRAVARLRLEALRGRTHSLHSGLAAARGGEIIWRHGERSDLTVREFSDAFLDAYLERAGDELTHSVGCYAYEGLGAQMFARVSGDYFAILGLPLLPVLDLLRREGLVAA